MHFTDTGIRHIPNFRELATFSGNLNYTHFGVKMIDIGDQNTYIWDQNHENTTP